MIGELKEGISIADEAGDDVTADMFTAFQEKLEKHVWMLNAYLSK